MQRQLRNAPPLTCCGSAAHAASSACSRSVSWTCGQSKDARAVQELRWRAVPKQAPGMTPTQCDTIRRHAIRHPINSVRCIQLRRALALGSSSSASCSRCWLSFSMTWMNCAVEGGKGGVADTHCKGNQQGREVRSVGQQMRAAAATAAISSTAPHLHVQLGLLLRQRAPRCAVLHVKQMGKQAGTARVSSQQTVVGQQLHSRRAVGGPGNALNAAAAAAAAAAVVRIPSCCSGSNTSPNRPAGKVWPGQAHKNVLHAKLSLPEAGSTGSTESRQSAHSAATECGMWGEFSQSRCADWRCKDTQPFGPASPMQQCIEAAPAATAPAPASHRLVLPGSGC